MTEYSGQATIDTLRGERFRRGRSGMTDMLIASLFINLLSLALPLVLLQIYDRIIPAAGESTLSLLVFGIGVALLLEALLRLGRSYIGGWMGARFEHIAGCEAMERILAANITDFERHGSGVHLERLNALRTVKEYYSGQAILVFCDLPFALLYLVIIGYLAGPLVFVPVFLILLFAASALFVGARLRQSLENRRTADDRRFNLIIEVLGAIHTLKSMAMENQILRRYEKLQEICTEAARRVIRHSSSALSIGAVFSQVTIFLVVGLGSLLVIHGALTVGGLVACTMLAGRAMQPLQRAVGIWTRFQSIRLAREQVEETLAIPPEAPPGLPALPPVRGALELRNVSFRYGRNRDGVELPLIFRETSLRVDAAETIGLVGANGSGKSTLLFLMSGLLQPTAGTVLLDGHDISAFDPASVRSSVAYLPQHGKLFNGTIIDNITMFRPEKTDDALAVARLLGLEQVVTTMPLGYRTPVGDGATDTVARGVKQRIAIVRALVDRPRVVLFDEANSAMDGAGDALLREFLSKLKGRCTLVLNTHRPSLLRLADRTFEIRDGTLVERAPVETRPPPRIEPVRPE